MEVLEVLTNTSLLNATAGALELSGVALPVAQGGAAVLLIQPQGASGAS